MSSEVVQLGIHYQKPEYKTVRALLHNPRRFSHRHWVSMGQRQLWLAVNRRGWECAPSDADACRWSLFGALQKIYGHDEARYWEKYNLVEAAVKKQYGCDFPWMPKRNLRYLIETYYGDSYQEALVLIQECDL